MFKGDLARDVHERVSAPDRKIDAGMWGFAKEALEEDQMQLVKDVEKNKKWAALRMALIRAKWNPMMVEAALKGVKPYTKTSNAEDHIAAFRFYNQMLLFGQEKAFAVINTPKHVGRLLKCTQKTTNNSVKQSLAQYLIDWITMFDGLDPCLELYRVCKELPVPAPEPSTEALAFKKEVHDQFFADKNNNGHAINHLAPAVAEPAKSSTCA